MMRSERADLEQPIADGESQRRLMAWSVRRAIELLDEAIDAMGAQLARSSAFMADLPVEPLSGRPRRSTGRRNGRRASISPRTPEIDAALAESQELHERQIS